MSLNKLTDVNIGKDIKLNIGCTNMECENMGCNSHFSQEIDTGKMVIRTADEKDITFAYPDQGVAGHVLHTDGVGNTYWAPDVGSASGIVYSGAGTQVGRHLKSASADGLSADNSVVIEDIGANTLDVGGLRVVNATDPTDPQDLSTKNYVDTQAVSLDLRKQFSTGLLSGGFMTINGGDSTKFDISAGTGIVVDATTGTFTEVNFPSWTALPIAGSTKETFVYIQSNTAPSISSVPLLPNFERNRIYLGNVYSPDTVNISSIDNQPNTAVNTNNSLNDLTNTIHHLNKNGNIISSSSGLTIQKSTGQAFAPGSNFNTDPKNPNFINLPSLDSNVDGLTYYMQNCSASSVLTTINPNNIDNGTNYPGTLMTAGYWSVQRVYSSCSTENKLHLMLGQYEYPTKAEAVNAVNSEGFNDRQCAVVNKDCLIGLIAVQQGATNLTNPANAEFLPLDKYGYSTKIDLTQLASKQYVDNQDALKVSKTGDDMSGNLNLTGTAVYQINSENIHNIIDRGNGNLISKGGGTLITTANNTVGLGTSVLNSITTQPNNVAIGDTAMANYKGEGSVAIGYRALIGNSSIGGGENVAIGGGALERQTNGSGNFALGTATLSFLTSGNNNIGIGTFCNEGLIGQNNTISIGSDIINENNDSIVIGKSGQSTQANQCVIHNVTEIVSGSDNICDLGSSTRRMKDLYLGGLINNLGVIGNSFTQTVSNTNSTATTPFSLIGSGVGSLSFPANSLVAGTTLKFKMTGEFTCANNDDLTFQFWGYTTPNINCDGSASAETFSLECDFTIRNTGVAASTALTWDFRYFNSSSIVGQKGGSTLTTIDTTTINTLDIINVLVDGGMIITSTTFTLDKSR